MKLQTKIKSFTLPELLVVMIITVIVVGIAFSVLLLVQKQIRAMENNFQKATTLSLVEQRLWQDFSWHNTIRATNEKLLLFSEIDTVEYRFEESYTLRNSDTLAARLTVDKLYYLGQQVKAGDVDAVSLSAQKELPDYFIFVSAVHDATHFMNKDGF